MDIIKLEQDKLNELTLLDDTSKAVIAKHIPKLAIPYYPLTKEFIGQYVLNPLEYPSFEGRISQAATEVSTRFHALVDKNYEYEKLLIEIQELEERVEVEGGYEQKKSFIELKYKRYRAAKIQQESLMQIKELGEYAAIVEEDFAKVQAMNPSVRNFGDIPFDKIRCAEMEAKVESWRQQQASGTVLTQPQLNIIEGEKVNKLLEDRHKKDGTK